MALLDDLTRRELVHDTTERAQLDAHLGGGPIVFYHGIDPTAASLHVGNLVGVVAMRRFQHAGHRPLALVGGATGMVGDPSGRSDERNLLDEETLALNIAGIRGQLERLVDFDGPAGARLVNNYDWTAGVSLLEFLRDVGKHATVNQMVAKESVRNRMEGESGISFTEFSYMLLQAFDYAWLYEHEGCTLQVGGSDQWGNITAGIDLIRRRTGAATHGLTWPLITRADGAKFGKSADGNVWLDPALTSPYAFHQYWIQTDDRDVGSFLRRFTLLPVGSIADLITAHEKAPEHREAQGVLAREMTTMVHGPAAARRAEAAARVLFGQPLHDADAETLEAVADEVGSTVVTTAELQRGADPVDLLVRSGLATSKSDARRALAEGSIYIDDERWSDNRPVDLARARFGQFVVLRRGKRRYHVARIEN